MWHFALQTLLILAVTIIALAIRYVLMDRPANWPKPHRLYLLHSAQKMRRHTFVRRRWLVILLVATGGLMWRQENSSPTFYPYGRFSVQASIAPLTPPPTPTPVHYLSYGRFTVATSPSPSH